MSLYGALFAGVSGLAANSQAMGMISDNIANLNTVGYKGTRARFSTLVTNDILTTTHSPAGVRSTPFREISQQGLLQTSESPTDIAISGAGFFVVKALTDGTGETLFTRAGSFHTDASGNLVNTSGYFLQAWPLDSEGRLPGEPGNNTNTTSSADLSSLETANVAIIKGIAAATTKVSLGSNLKASQAAFTGTYDPTVSANNMASGNVTPQFSRSVRIFDAQGTGHDLRIAFLKTASNTWQIEVFAATSSEVTVSAPLVDGQIATGTVTFNGDATLATVSAGLSAAATIQWTNGATDSAITIDWGTAGPIGTGKSDGLSQFDGSYNIAFLNQNGAEVGELNGIRIDDDGFVIASFNNGQTTRLYKVPIATFPNANALQPGAGNAYAQTGLSGELNLREAGVGGAGMVAPGALEAANIDLAREFTDMIIAQRAYSASSRVITTVDEMLDELIRIRR